MTKQHIANVSVASQSNKLKRSEVQMFDLFRVRVGKKSGKWGDNVYMAAGVTTQPPSDNGENVKYKSINLTTGVDAITYKDSVVEVIGKAELNIIIHKDYADLAAKLAA